MSQKSFIDTVDHISTHAKKEKIAHLSTQDKKLIGNYITINETKLVNFGSCSYLGLEFNHEIREAAKEAIDAYGTQFSSSRAYVSPIYYQSLEEKLSKIFNAPTIVTPTTTLGHSAAIPVLVTKDDAIILDHQVHSSVQTAVNLVKAKNVHVELVRHNRMDLLEAKIIELRANYKNIWYMADGIYSMYGDMAPLDEIYALLDKYDNFNFYVDDAHGMSCFGDKGQGYVLADRNIHARMVVATSFAKAFATGGGALIFPTAEMAQKVRNCGGPLITSGPMQPSALGAANRVADMHLSGEIKPYQEDLQQNIMYTNLMLKKHKLPNLAEEKTAIFFIAVSLPKIAYKLIDRVKQDGFFLNLGIFPAVPIKNTGVRFTITSLHTFAQIDAMVASMALHYYEILEEENIEIESIYKAFKISNPFEQTINNKVESIIKYSALSHQYTQSIHDVDTAEWNNAFKNQACIDTNALNVLEESFSSNESAINNWDFHYLLVHDPENKLILATYLTVSTSKDDMLFDRQISREIEEKREKDPYYMTSKTLSLGSPVSEGKHLFIDTSSPYWKEALDLLFRKIGEIQEGSDIATTILRDFETSDEQFDDYFLNNGYFKYQMPNNLKLKNISWEDQDEFYQELSKKKKGHFRRNIIKHSSNYELVVKDSYSNKEIEAAYQLYLNVKQKSLEINTFTLPLSYFKNIAINNKWEILSLYLFDSNGKKLSHDPVAVGFCYKGNVNYSFAMVGVDYSFNAEFSCYRQMLWQVIRRAQALGFKNVDMGYTSEIEKRHFGAKVVETCAYMQIKDNYTLEALGTMTTTNKSEDGVNKRRILSI